MRNVLLENPDRPRQRLQKAVAETNLVVFESLLAKTRRTGSEGNPTTGTGPFATSRQGRTRESDEFVRQIHTRMPVIVQEEHHEAWLSGEAGKEILVPFPTDRMKAWPISARVNSSKKQRR